MSEKRVSGEPSLHAAAAKTWSSAQEQLRSMLSSDTYNLWFAPLRADAIEGNALILEVANDFCEVWLKENYTGLLQDVLTVAGDKADAQPGQVRALGERLKHHHVGVVGRARSRSRPQQTRPCLRIHADQRCRVSRELLVPEDQAGRRVQPRDEHAGKHGEGVMIASLCSLDELSLVHGPPSW